VSSFFDIYPALPGTVQRVSHVCSHDPHNKIVIANVLTLQG
jgi:hypothetical protein